MESWRPNPQGANRLNWPVTFEWPALTWPPSQGSICASSILLPCLSSTLANSCGVGERIRHAVPDMAWNFDSVSVRPGHERNLMAPYFAAYRGYGIAECEDCFWIPCSGFRFEPSRRGKIVRPECDDGEHAE